jgi:hypothetical protein
MYKLQGQEIWKYIWVFFYETAMSLACSIAKWTSAKVIEVMSTESKMALPGGHLVYIDLNSKYVLNVLIL